jgi:hypothetical protein
MSKGTGEVAPARQLFLRRAVKDGRTVVLLRGLEAGKECAIQADVYPVTAPGGDVVALGPHSFATLDDALTFVEETLLALEYLGCAIYSGTADGTPGVPETPLKG